MSATDPSSGSRVLLSVHGFDPSHWHGLLSRRRDVVLEPDGADDPSIRYAVVWKQPAGLLSKLPNLKAIFSTGAGVDHLAADPSIPDIPVVRVVSPNLTGRMVEYVVWRVLDHLRKGAMYRAQQVRHVWHEPPQPFAGDVSVGILGMGELGEASARALDMLGFKVRGWSRGPKQVPNVESFHGQDGLAPFLAGTDILVVLLPLTRATHGIVDYDLLRALRRDNALGGAVLINGGRGGLQKSQDILRALDDGTLMEASLDVFETEPLPADSPVWDHPRIFVTPHAAAATDPECLAPVILDQMDAFDRGETAANLVDRAAGY